MARDPLAVLLDPSSAPGQRTICWHFLVIAVASLVAAPRAILAQRSDSVRKESSLLVSMGQPPRTLPYASIFGLVARNSPTAFGALVGAYRPILNPVGGLFGISGEALFERDRSDAELGLRAVANVPVLGFGIGADWCATCSEVDLLLTFQTAIRRGGILGRGSAFRFDWLPSRSNSRSFGMQLPLLQPFAGRTRPRATTVSNPPQANRPSIKRSKARLVDSAERALRDVTEATKLIAGYTHLYSTRDGDVLDTLANGQFAGRSFEQVVRSHHQALAHSFAMAMLDSSRGLLVSEKARAIMLEHVLLPYNGLFGQAKSPGVMEAMIEKGHEYFVGWLRDSTASSEEARSRAQDVFDRWSDIVANLHRDRVDRVKDTRLVWLPPQLALAPEQYDEQEEVDRLLGRAVGTSITGNNALAYLRTADLPLEIARSILAARRYHVLWTHDFTGRRPSGRLDQISYTLVADAYLPALTAAVEAYDSTGSLPQYLILLDAFYYHGRYGQLFMDILENPLTAGVSLHKNELREAEHLRERLASLRTAVARSKRLQSEAARNGGASWLTRVVKVHVNVMLPSDFSFRSSHTLPPIPFTPDNIVRDHRKIAFYDLSEADPDEGQLLVAGIGIGEHYASATWEDRGYRLRGSGALEARDAVRRMLTWNGFADDQVPVVLRPTKPVIRDSGRAYRRRDVARVLQVHNEPGFAAKRASVARAMLYSLAPAGSVVIVPDPLWLSDTWAGMLAAAATRGCRVVVIAPSKANAPSPQAPLMALERDVLRKLVSLRHRFATRIRNSGGDLRIGVYAARAPVDDVRGRIAEVRDGLKAAPWIRDLIPFDNATLSALDRATAQAARNDSGSILAQDEKPRDPKLHQKTELIARPGAIATLVRQRGWADILAETIRLQSQETARLADAITAPVPAPDTAAARRSEELLQSYERSLSEAERTRLSFYFTLGTQNHDPRGLALDGETSLIVSGFDASVGLVDLFYMMARTTWVEEQTEIDALVPAPNTLMVRLARILRLAL
jgi:hypothetical protein